jgi:hypothetical protein
MRAPDQQQSPFAEPYSEAEWRAIEDSLWKLCNGPLPDVLRSRLREYALSYWLNSSYQAFSNTMRKIHRGLHRKRWQKVVHFAEKTREALQVAIDTEQKTVEALQAIRLKAVEAKPQTAISTEQKTETLQVAISTEPAGYDLALGPDGACQDHYLKVLADLESAAIRLADLSPTYRGISSDARFEGINNKDARIIYQAHVLGLWTYLGGTLGISRNNKQKIQGPLATYFFAVARPVMGASTPSPETLPDIVNRQKRLISEV